MPIRTLSGFFGDFNRKQLILGVSYPAIVSEKVAKIVKNKVTWFKNQQKAVFAKKLQKPTNFEALLFWLAHLSLPIFISALEEKEEEENNNSNSY